MKKCILLVLLLLGAALFMSACMPNNGAPLQSQQPQISDESESKQPEIKSASIRKFRVGVSLQDESPFVLRVSESLQNLVMNKAPDVELVIYNGKGSPFMQIAHVESFISGGFNLVLLDPISYEECAPAVTIAKEEGVPVINFVTRVSNGQDCLSFVGSKHIESGIIQADMVAKYLAGNGSIVILEGVMGIDSQKSRYEGYQQVLKNYPGIKTVAIQTAAWQRPEAKAIVQNWIESGKKFDAVVSENDNMAMGAIEVIEQAGLSDSIKVFGIDGDSDALQAVKDGRMAGTVYHDADKQAQTLFECIQKLKVSKKIESEYIIPFEPVTPENVNYYLSLYKQ